MNLEGIMLLVLCITVLILAVNIDFLPCFLTHRNISFDILLYFYQATFWLLHCSLCEALTLFLSFHLAVETTLTTPTEGWIQPAAPVIQNPMINIITLPTSDTHTERSTMAVPAKMSRNDRDLHKGWSISWGRPPVCCSICWHKVGFESQL